MSSAPHNIPSGWKWLPLGELITVAQYGLSTKANPDTGVPLLRMTNQENGRITGRDLKYVELTEADKAKFKVEVGDILFNRTNSFELVGRAAMFDLPGDFVFASYLIRLRTKPDKLLPEFLTLYFVGDATQRRLKSIATRAVSQSNISATRLKDFPIPLPPLPEQKKIAHVLSTVQRAIEAQERIIQTTTELKRALMQKLFTEGLCNEPQKQTEIGPVPESWEVVPLSAVCTFQSGGTPSKKNPTFWDGNIPWVSPKDMKRPRLDDAADHISEKGLRNGSNLAPAGSVFVVVRGMILAKTVPVALAEVPMAINQDIKAIVSGSKLRSDFLLYAFETFRHNLFKKVGRSGHGTATLMSHEVAAFKIPLPDLKIQKQIASAIQNLERKKELHEEKRDQLRDLFRTLLHELMTAKTRVHELEIAG